MVPDGTVGEKRKQPSRGITVGPSPPRHKYKDVKHPYQCLMTAAAAGGGGLGGLGTLLFIPLCHSSTASSLLY